jgi:hypothetical protein
VGAGVGRTLDAALVDLTLLLAELLDSLTRRVRGLELGKRLLLRIRLRVRRLADLAGSAHLAAVVGGLSDADRHHYGQGSGNRRKLLGDVHSCLPLPLVSFQAL